ncbi:MAG: hypothetical protein FWG98_09655 [Candidatus Cloacimonetes bacterium]|nr:hypothetical protein [Candidatus Cloacimonadota bacterium]
MTRRLLRGEIQVRDLATTGWGVVTRRLLRGGYSSEGPRNDGEGGRGRKLKF